jgi:hypothetical protein
MARILGLTPEAVRSSIERLVEADLVAARDPVVQVLPVPELARSTVRSTDQPKQISPSAPRSPEVASEPVVGETDILEHEAEARAHMARFLGQRAPASSAVRGLAKALAMKAKSAARRRSREQTTAEVNRRG